jgi:transposase-like protein
MTEFACCVYWIRAPTHGDIFKEGYVGIAQNFENRINQHIYNSKNPNNWHSYRTEFREALSSGDYLAEIILLAERDYCLYVEQALRPSWKIGWNIARGGEGGVGKHGLSGSKLAKTYYNILTRADLEGEDVFTEWLTSEGLENFKTFYDSLAGQEGHLTLKERGMGYNPENLIRLPRSEIVRKAYSRYDIGDGNLYSVKTLAEMFDMKPNKISSRLRNGWTIREAVGLEQKVKPKVCLSTGICAEYNGKWSKDQIEAMRVAYESGVPVTEIEREHGIDVSNLLRFARMFRFKRDNRSIKFTDLMGNSCELGLRSNLTSELIESCKIMLINGKSLSQITEELCIPITKVYRIKEVLRWKEYEKEKSVGG